MISSSVAKGLDYGVIGVLGAGVVLCLFGLISACCLPNCKQRKRLEFFGSWAVRACLCLLSLCWLASQVLRMTHIWAQTTLLTEELAGSVGLLCRLYMSLALGLFQPWTLWLALLLCRNTISSTESRRWQWCLPCICTKQRKSHTVAASSKPVLQSIKEGKTDGLQNTADIEKELIPAGGKLGRAQRVPADGVRNGLRLVGLALLATLPFLAIQTVIAWLSYILRHGPQWDTQPDSAGNYFFSPFDIGTGAQCPVELQSEGCVMCVFPAASTVVTLAFTLLYSWVWIASARHMKRYVINRKLLRRLNILEVIIISALALQVTMAGVSLVASPWEVVFEVCWVVFAFTTTVLVIALVWILAVFPLWSLLMAHKSAVSEAPSYKLQLYEPTELEMQLWPKGESASSSPLPT